jgi:hypothetical protein
MSLLYHMILQESPVDEEEEGYRRSNNLHL